VLIDFAYTLKWTMDRQNTYIPIGRWRICTSSELVHPVIYILPFVTYIPTLSGEYMCL